MLPFAKHSFGSSVVGRENRTRPKTDARSRKIDRLLSFPSTKSVLGEAHLFGDYYALEIRSASKDERQSK